MLIDWFTVAAQTLNFIVLVWLLKRFLYKPILAAIDARERHIADELAAAARRQTEAQKSRDEFNTKKAHLNDERAALSADALRDAQSKCEGLLTDARGQAADLIARQRAALREDGDAVLDRLMRLVTDEVFAIARKALDDLASSGFEERLADVFTQRLRDISAESKHALGTALARPDVKAIIRTHYDLGADERAKVTAAVNETFAADIHLMFETTPQGGCGIDLTAGGQRIGWGIQDYIDGFRAKTDALLGSRSVAAA